MRTAESASLDVTVDIEALIRVLREHPVRLAILFGSLATEESHSRSDIDLAVEFDGERPSDPSYNETFLGLSADLCQTLGTDDVDLVDIRTASTSLATSIFEDGILLVGTQDYAAKRRRELTTPDPGQQSPRERLDAALDRIDGHLGDSDDGVPVTGDTGDDG